jgi:hypothetical protein
MALAVPQVRQSNESGLQALMDASVEKPRIAPSMVQIREN